MGEMIKCLYFPYPDKPYNGEFDELFKKFDTLMLNPDKCETYKTWKHNELHHTPDSYKTYIIPELMNFLKVQYSPNDFNWEKRISKSGYDVSYPVPVKNKKFKIHYRGKDFIGDYKRLIGHDKPESKKNVFTKYKFFRY